MIVSFLRKKTLLEKPFTITCVLTFFSDFDRASRILKLRMRASVAPGPTFDRGRPPRRKKLLPITSTFGQFNSAPSSWSSGHLESKDCQTQQDKMRPLDAAGFCKTQMLEISFKSSSRGYCFAERTRNLKTVFVPYTCLHQLYSICWLHCKRHNRLL